MSLKIAEIIAEVSGAQGPVSIHGVLGGARALLASELAKLASKKTFLIVTATEERARQFVDDAGILFTPENFRRIAIFPESSALPYSRLSSEPEEWADRLNILYRLTHSEPIIIVAPVTAILRRVPPKKFLSDNSRTVRPKQRIDPVEFSDYLTSNGYEDVGLVEDEGTFARRGGIIDFWPPTTGKPVRLELDGELLTSMREFDPASQRSKGDIAEVVLIPVRDIPFDKESRELAVAKIRKRAEDKDLPTRERRTITEALREGIAFSGIETFLPLFHEKTATFFDYLPDNAAVLLDDSLDIESVANANSKEISELSQNTQSPERIIDINEITLSWGEVEDALKKFQLTLLGASQMLGACRSIRRKRKFQWRRISEEDEQKNRRRSCSYVDGFFTKSDEAVRMPMKFAAGEYSDRLLGTDFSGGSELVARISSNADIQPLIQSHGRGEDMLSPLIAQVKKWQEEDFRVVFTCHTELQATRIADLFRWHGIEIQKFEGPFETIFDLSGAQIRLRIGRLSRGFRWEAEKLAVITDEEIFGTKVAKRQIATRPMEPFTSFAEIAKGDYIVHERHGIGRYVDLTHLTLDGIAGDYLLIEYLGGDKLYLPVYRLNLIGRYIGSGEAAPFLDRLGGTRWAEVQKKVDASIRLMARELLDIYAAREIFPGFQFPPSIQAYEEFSAAFPYDETPDQARSIDEVMRDMGIEKPMDRLICGDVGYGKTEVAMRAAFRAAIAGKQVAVLVPTTVLAFQHYETFTRRFQNTPVQIEMFSRFRSKKEIKASLEGLRRGTVDIAIGTHRLIQKDIHFKDLGLLIIDEEHRFGVRHKERIKKLRTTVDVITLTATPIPRTLNLSLSGIRDISIINTPPADRLSIATYVVPFDEGTIRQAFLKEMARGGQVFFVHNRVETISSMHDRLKRLVPEARIVVGHGQLPEGELEDVMISFMTKEADVLLCTTIIESGLDISAANTIIINRADTFGLAQLYQLRGRVGRSSVRASAYLLIPEEGEVSTLAKKRLAVLKRFTELGSGFQIAMHDLEFRGAGNILGGAQSGHIAAVGYELYAKLLDRAVRKLRGKKIEEDIDPELNLKIAAFLPEAYIEDAAARIEIYRRLANRENDGEIAAIGDELSDRFGPLPHETENLLGLMEIKLMAKMLRIPKLAFDGAFLVCEFDALTPLSTQGIMDLAKTQPGRFRILPPDRLKITLEGAHSDTEIILGVKNSLSELEKQAIRAA